MVCSCPPKAHYIKMATCSTPGCDCGTTVLRLYARDDVVFAEAHMPPETALGLIETIGAHLDDVFTARRAKLLHASPQ